MLKSSSRNRKKKACNFFFNNESSTFRIHVNQDTFKDWFIQECHGSLCVNIMVSVKKLVKRILKNKDRDGPGTCNLCGSKDNVKPREVNIDDTRKEILTLCWGCRLSFDEFNDSGGNHV